MSRFGKTRKKVAQRTGRGPNPDKVYAADREVNDPNALSAEDLKAKSQGVRAGLQGLNVEEILRAQLNAIRLQEKIDAFENEDSLAWQVRRERGLEALRRSAVATWIAEPEKAEQLLKDGWADAYTSGQNSTPPIYPAIPVKKGPDGKPIDYFNEPLKTTTSQHSFTPNERWDNKPKLATAAGGAQPPDNPGDNFGIPDGKTAEEFFEKLTKKGNDFPGK